VKFGRPSSFLSLAVRETCRCLPVTTNLANEDPSDMLLIRNRIHTYPRQHNQIAEELPLLLEELFQHGTSLGS
jgi:hypothetical protein